MKDISVKKLGGYANNDDTGSIEGLTRRLLLNNNLNTHGILCIVTVFFSIDVNSPTVD